MSERFTSGLMIRPTVAPDACRFVHLGAAGSVTALVYYATPQEVIGRVTVFPTTIVAVMFPAFSAAAAQRSPDVTRLFEKTSLYSHLMLFPITFVMAAFAPFWLSLWMGADFAARSTSVTQWFCLGVFVNGLAVTPVGFLQAAGRGPYGEVSSRAPVYWIVDARTAHFGMTGAAIAWPDERRPMRS
jgi:O-antigen/teichoic acid export membrane protein